jgi:hypothetical protein
MIRTALALALTLTPLLAQAPPRRAVSPILAAAPASVTHIPQGMLANLEKAFDLRLFQPESKDFVEPLDSLGGTRGLYLEGYGTVFTTELMLIVTPNESPFRPVMPEPLKQQIHERKLAQLPKLQEVMKELVKMTALTLTPMPDDQKITFAIRVRYYMWENTTGLPAQIVMSAEKKAAQMGDIKTVIE